MKQKIDCNWHRYVDLGLPSGLLWATCNVGAKEPWESGLYFSWGNVDGHAKGSGYDFSEIEYAATPGATLDATLIGKIPVNTEYDAARANFGGSWRMPTSAEFKELYDNCTSEWTTQNGFYGRLFISMINGNRVFFPAAGFYYCTSLVDGCDRGAYWSSSIVLQYYVQYLCLHNKNVYPQNYNNRFYGFPVRAVLGHPKDSLLIKTIKR